MATHQNLIVEAKDFTMAHGVTDGDIKALHPTLFLNIPTAGYVQIYSNKALTVKPQIGANSAGSVPMTASTTLIFGKDNIPLRGITNLLITNASGAEAAITVIIADPEYGVL